jgi:hypothetical protein
MGKQIAQSPEIFNLLKNATDGYARLQAGLKDLYKKRLINRNKWKKEILPADLAFFVALRELWVNFEKQNAAIDIASELVREDQLAGKWNVSRKTLYRRRKSRELPYIKDRHGAIWYAVTDVENYLEKNKITPLNEKPRKI